MIAAGNASATLAATGNSGLFDDTTTNESPETVLGDRISTVDPSPPSMGDCMIEYQVTVI